MSPEYDRLIKILAFAVYDNVYGPVDRMARALDKSMVLTSVYDALRYISTEIRKCIDAKQGKRSLGEEDRKRCEKLEEFTKLEIPHEDINNFLQDLDRRGPEIAKRIALKALSLGLEMKKKELG